MHTSEWVLLNYLTGDQFLGQAWYVPNVTLHTTHYEFFCLKFEKKKKKADSYMPCKAMALSTKYKYAMGPTISNLLSLCVW